jgi:hypothetical protein
VLTNGQHLTLEAGTVRTTHLLSPEMRAAMRPELLEQLLAEADLGYRQVLAIKSNDTPVDVLRLIPTFVGR